MGWPVIFLFQMVIMQGKFQNRRFTYLVKFRSEDFGVAIVVDTQLIK